MFDGGLLTADCRKTMPGNQHSVAGNAGLYLSVLAHLQAGK